MRSFVKTCLNHQSPVFPVHDEIRTTLIRIIALVGRYLTN
jgi:hypothetical protein